MLDGKSIDKILRDARTHNGFQNKPVTDAQIRELYEMLRWGPTSSNSQPARFVFVRTKEGKERLRPALSSGNTAKTMEAPVTAIVAYDTQFHEHLPRIFPHNPTAQSWFTGPGNEQVAFHTAFRNGTLQGAYLMLAARALGLDCGPMSGFDAKGVDEAFFAGTTWRTNFICNLGYGSDENLFQRLPRLAFDEACRIL